MARPPAIVRLVTTELNVYTRPVLKQLKRENLKRVGNAVRNSSRKLDLQWIEILLIHLIFHEYSIHQSLTITLIVRREFSRLQISY